MPIELLINDTAPGKIDSDFFSASLRLYLITPFLARRFPADDTMSMSML